MPTFILDLVIQRVQIQPGCPRLNRSVWLVVRSDGVNQNLNTSQIPPGDVMQWDMPARLILNVPNIKEAYLQFNLFTFSDIPNQSRVAALSQVVLSSLPAGSPKSVTIPLMCSFNTSEVAAVLTMTATISLLGPLPNEIQQQQNSRSPFVVTPVQSPVNNYNQASYSQPNSQFNGNYNNKQYMQSQPPQYQIPPQYQQPQTPIYPQYQSSPPSSMYQQQPPPPQMYQQQQQQYPEQIYQQQQQQHQQHVNPKKMPVNPYKVSSSREPMQVEQNQQPKNKTSKKVHYPPFPPLNPPESSVFGNHQF